MRAILGALLLLMPLSLHAAEVSLEIHKEMNGYDYYSKPLPTPSWNKDGTLSVWHQAHGNGSYSVVETGAHVVQNTQALSLCYSRRAVHYEPNQPIPAVLYPVIVEFRIRGLSPGEYTVQEVSICK